MVIEKPILTFSNVTAIIDDEFAANQLDIVLLSKRPKPLKEVYLIQLGQADNFSDMTPSCHVSAEHFIACVQKHHEQLKQHGVSRITSLARFGNDGEYVLYADLKDTHPTFHLQYCGDGYLDYFDGWYCLVSPQ